MLFWNTYDNNSSYRGLWAYDYNTNTWEHLGYGEGNNEKTNLPTTKIDYLIFSQGVDIFDIFKKSGLCKSKGEARRLLLQGGIYINEVRINEI